MSGFLYLAQPDGMPIYKIGSTFDPDARAYALQGQTPHQFRFLRVLDLGALHRARAYEKHIQSWLNAHSSHGEWFTDLDAIHELFDEAVPAVDVTERYNAPNPRKPKYRKPESLDRLEYRIAIGELRDAGVMTASVFGNSSFSSGRMPENWRERYAAWASHQPSRHLTNGHPPS